MNILDEIKLDCENEMRMYDQMPVEYRDIVKEYECCDFVYKRYKYGFSAPYIRNKLVEAINNVTR